MSIESDAVEAAQAALDIAENAYRDARAELQRVTQEAKSALEQGSGRQVYPVEEVALANDPTKHSGLSAVEQEIASGVKQVEEEAKTFEQFLDEKAKQEIATLHADLDAVRGLALTEPNPLDFPPTSDGADAYQQAVADAESAVEAGTTSETEPVEADASQGVEPTVGAETAEVVTDTTAAQEPPVADEAPVTPESDEASSVVPEADSAQVSDPVESPESQSTDVPSVVSDPVLVEADEAAAIIPDVTAPAVIEGTPDDPQGDQGVAGEVGESPAA